MNFNDVYKKIADIDRGVSKPAEVKEAIHVSVDTPQEADMVKRLISMAGVTPMDTGSPLTQANGSSDCHCEDPANCECDEQQEEDYQNRPDEKVMGIDTMMAGGGDLNRPKTMYRKEYPGDNHMSVRESVTTKLRAFYKEYKTR